MHADINCHTYLFEKVFYGLSRLKSLFSALLQVQIQYILRDYRAKLLTANDSIIRHNISHLLRVCCSRRVDFVKTINPKSKKIDSTFNKANTFLTLLNFNFYNNTSRHFLNFFVFAIIQQVYMYMVIYAYRIRVQVIN